MTEIRKLTFKDTDGEEKPFAPWTVISAVEDLQRILDNMLVDAELTGVPTAPTAEPGTNNNQVATTEYVDNAVETLDYEYRASVRLRGTLGEEGTLNNLPAFFNTGDLYIVLTPGEYGGHPCERGDMLLCTSAPGVGVADWAVIQGNIINPVRGPGASVDGNIALFDGESGTVIRDSGYSMSDIMHIIPESGVEPGTYDKVTVDKQGHVIEGAVKSAEENLSGTGIESSAEEVDAAVEWSKQVPICVLGPTDPMPVNLIPCGLIIRSVYYEDGGIELPNDSIFTDVIVDKDNPAVDMPDTSVNVDFGPGYPNNVVIRGDHVKIDEAELESTVLRITAESGARLINVKATGIIGSKDTVAWHINTRGYVYVADCNLNQTRFDFISVCPDIKYAAKNVLIANVEFGSLLANNAVCVHSVAEGAIITLKNIHAANVCNLLRISNSRNVNLTVNIENCVVDKWDINPAYSGLVVCQDQESSPSVFAARNAFGPSRLTINIKGCTGPNGLITAPTDIADVLGNGSSSQLVYVYADNAGGLLPYSEYKDYYPVVNIT